MAKLSHILITLTFSFSCFGLWTVLNVLAHLSPQSTAALPGFTALMVNLREWLLLFPIPVIAYTIYTLVRRVPEQCGTTTFLACTMGTLCLLFFPVLLAMFLPCVVLMEQSWLK